MSAAASASDPGCRVWKPYRIRVWATITTHGAKLTGYPVGTVLPWHRAKSLPPGEPDGPRVAIWTAVRH